MGYWEKSPQKQLEEWLDRNNIPKLSIHTSGHANPGDLQKFVTAINPHKVVPIHTFFPGRYAELFQNVELHNDGEWWEV